MTRLEIFTQDTMIAITVNMTEKEVATKLANCISNGNAFSIESATVNDPSKEKSHTLVLHPDQIRVVRVITPNESGLVIPQIQVSRGS